MISNLFAHGLIGLGLAATGAMAQTGTCSSIGQWSEWDCQASCDGILSRTAWQMHHGTEVTASNPNGFVQLKSGCNKDRKHGAICEYDSSPGIPGADDARWIEAYNPETIGMKQPSRLCNAPQTCWTYLDFTYFQTFVNIPKDYKLTEFSIKFDGMDDGSRVTVFNSKYPNGLVVAGSYVYLNGQGTTNLVSYVVAGEVNRVVVTQVDDCCAHNNLQVAAVSLNGALVNTDSCKNTNPIATGIKTRTRDLKGLTTCGAAKETGSCSMDACPVCCQVSAWSEWSQCSCGGDAGMRNRTRTVVSQAMNGGDDCPNLVEVEKCPNGAATVTPVCTAAKPHKDVVAYQLSSFDGRFSPAFVGAKNGYHMPTSTFKWVPGNTYGIKMLYDHRNDRISTTIYDAKGTYIGVATSSPISQKQNKNAWCNLTNLDFLEISIADRDARGQVNFTDVLITELVNDVAFPNAAKFPKNFYGNGKYETYRLDAPVGIKGFFLRANLHLGKGFGSSPVQSQVYVSVGCRKQSCADGGANVGAQVTCPKVDCVMGPWSAWSGCSANCGAGTRTRTRAILTKPENGGKVCGATTESLGCEGTQCPVDCVVSPYTTGPCNATCDGTSPTATGTLKKTRYVVTQPAYGGKQCPELETTEPCTKTGCPVDCVVSQWSAWSCSAKCDGTVPQVSGQNIRKRTVVTAPLNGGKQCPALEETATCTATCAVDCVVSGWVPNGECTAACDGVSASHPGTQAFVREVMRPSANGGKTCPALTKTEPCTKSDCHVDCKVGAWTEWSECDIQCGHGGSSSRTRPVLTAPLHSGKACPALSEARECVGTKCPVDCVLSDFDYSECSAECVPGSASEVAKGVMMGVRKVLVEAANGGKACEGDLTVEKECEINDCPVDCKVSAWTEWACDASQHCDGMTAIVKGTQTRTRTVEVEAKNGGLACPALHQSGTCSWDCDVDCQVGEWVPGECEAECVEGSAEAHGKQLFQRIISVARANSGKDCPPLDKTEDCVVTSCPVSCVVSEWSDYGACSTDCGIGTQTRTRTVLRSPVNGGDECPELEETRSCVAVEKCPVDCIPSDWVEGECDAVCDGNHRYARGQKTGTRTIVTHSAYGGAECPDLEWTEDCEIQCDVTCKFAPWSEWSACSTGAEQCDGTVPFLMGESTRTRAIISGLECEDQAREAHSCQVACEVPCQVSAWSEWTCQPLMACAANPTEAGKQTRSRTVVTYPANGGAVCPALTETGDCTFVCDEAGAECEREQESEWSEWSQCDCQDGDSNGLKYRTRSMSANGLALGCPVKETAACEPCVPGVVVPPFPGVDDEELETPVPEEEERGNNNAVIIGASVGAAGAALLVGAGYLLYRRMSASGAAAMMGSEDLLSAGLQNTVNPLFTENTAEVINPLFNDDVGPTRVGMSV